MDTNKITGPGYYPRRPSPPAGKAYAFAGDAYYVRVMTPNRTGWDSVSWHGSGTYSARCIISPSNIGGLVVEDIDGNVLFDLRLPKPIHLKVGEAYTFTLENPTPRVENGYVTGQWTVPR